MWESKIQKMIGALIALCVLLIIAVAACVADSMGYIHIMPAINALYYSNSPAGVVTVRHRPFDGMTSVQPKMPPETISASGVGGRHLMPLETISASSKVDGRHLMPLETISASSGVGGRHLMPLETIGKEMAASSSAALPPLETIDTGDSNLVYASG